MYHLMVGDYVVWLLVLVFGFLGILGFYSRLEELTYQLDTPISRTAL